MHRRLRTLVLATVFALCGSGLATAAVQPTQVNVRMYGATGDGVTNDTAAIQRANDAVFAKGGGRVYFPAGTYIVAGVQQDSNVEFFGTRDAVLKHTNGVSPSSIVKARRVEMRGSVAAGSRVLRLSSLARVRVGAVVAIRGAAGSSPVRYLYDRVSSIGSGQVTLETAVPVGVTNALVYIGAVNVAVRGLTLDGNRVTDGTMTPTNAVPIEYVLARWAKVSDTMIVNGARGAVAFDLGTSDSIIEDSTLRDSGRPDLETGSAVWLFRGATRNTVRNNIIDGLSYQGVFIDDRTVNASEWDAPSNDNVVENNAVDIAPVNGHCGIQISGSEHTIVRYNTLRWLNRGICVNKSYQSTPPVDARYNTVTNNTLTGHIVGVEVTGSWNTFADNLITNSRWAVKNTGSDNTFS